MIGHGRALSLLACLAVAPASADELPRWELGLGLSAVSLPDYRGSDESHSWILPFPHIVYRGERLRIDRNSLNVLLRQGRLSVDYSLAASPPVDSGSNAARAGMPDLKPTLESGVSAKYELWSDAGENRRLRAILPLRAVVATDLRDTRWAGWVLVPGLAYQTGLNDPDRWRLSASIAAQWADARNNAYFYGVAPSDATATRSAYTATAGYGGANLTLSASRRYGGWWLGGFVRYDRLDGATFRDSPLLKTHENLWAGLAVSRVLWTSRAPALSDE